MHPHRQDPSSITVQRDTAPLGFTMAELLVATGVTVLMLFLVNRLFFDTANAVRKGVAISQVVANSRSISDQIEQDARAMTGPSEGGFLVIINRRYTDVQVPEYVIPPLITGDPTLDRPDPQTITQRNVRSDQLVFIRNAEDLEPLTPQSNGSFANGNTATYARVWYGHALRTDPDGTGPSGDLGTPGGPNDPMQNWWILGRQALLLADSPDFIQARTAAFNSPIIGTGASNDPLLYMGLTDVANFPLRQITGSEGAVPQPILHDGLDRDTYQDRAYQYAFVEPDGSTLGRLRVNPTPNNRTFTSGQVAQMHPYFMEHVSDFVVEFAADLKDNDDPATTRDDGFPDNEPDIDDVGAPWNNGAGNNGTRNLIWYGLGNHEANPRGDDHYRTADPANRPLDTNTLSTDEIRWVFRHDTPEHWPYLIRIRYRLHDPNGQIQSHVGDSFGWPEPGQWFEQILVVNRQ